MNRKDAQKLQMNMTDEQKAKELVEKWCDINHHNKDLAPDVYDAVMDMAKWKEQQMLDKIKDKKLSETIEYAERNGFFQQNEQIQQTTPKFKDMENYKKMYENALNKAKEIYNREDASESGKSILESMFPELNAPKSLIRFLINFNNGE